MPWLPQGVQVTCSSGVLSQCHPCHAAQHCWHQLGTQDVHPGVVYACAFQKCASFFGAVIIILLWSREREE